MKTNRNPLHPPPCFRRALHPVLVVLWLACAATVRADAKLPRQARKLDVKPVSADSSACIPLPETRVREWRQGNDKFQAAETGKALSAVRHLDLWAADVPDIPPGGIMIIDSGLDPFASAAKGPNPDFMEFESKAVTNQPEAFRKRIFGHVYDKLTAFKGVIAGWNAVNEPHSNRTVEEVLGHGALVEIFKMAHGLDPAAKASSPRADSWAATILPLQPAGRRDT